VDDVTADEAWTGARLATSDAAHRHLRADRGMRGAAPDICRPLTTKATLRNPSRWPWRPGSRHGIGSHDARDA
jgi:hypothetical protein